MQPAISSGLLAADAVILAVPGKLMGLLLISDGTNATTLDVWDSPTSDTTGDTRLGQIDIGASPGAGSLSQGIWFGPNGIQAYKGIWADVTQAAGTLQFYVWYA